MNTTYVTALLRDPHLLLDVVITFTQLAIAVGADPAALQPVARGGA